MTAPGHCTAAGDRLSPLDPDPFQDRQRLVLSLRPTHAITHWWEQILLLGYNRTDFLFKDPFNPHCRLRCVEEVLGFSSAGMSSVRGGISANF
jgi:hypothetical protein